MSEETVSGGCASGMHDRQNEHSEHHDHHHHGLHHHHEHHITSLNKAFIIGISLNVLFVIVEFAAGFWYGSMGLMSDAGHNLGDAASLVMAMLAFRLAKVSSNQNYTYGYRKSTVLVSLLNAVILLVAVGFIFAESVEKLISPRPVNGDAVAWVAALGVVVNAFTAWLFMKDKEKDLNVRGAYLHMAADALVSLGVIVSGLLMDFTGWYMIDPLIGMGIALMIVMSTWGLLKDSLRLSLDGVPSGIHYDQIGRVISETPGISSFHHLHIWALSTTENALTAHIIPHDMEKMEEIKAELKARLKNAGVCHATLEFEHEGCCCLEKTCMGI